MPSLVHPRDLSKAKALLQYVAATSWLPCHFSKETTIRHPAKPTWRAPCVRRGDATRAGSNLLDRIMTQPHFILRVTRQTTAAASQRKGRWPTRMRTSPSKSDPTLEHPGTARLPARARALMGSRHQWPNREAEGGVNTKGLQRHLHRHQGRQEHRKRLKWLARQETAGQQGQNATQEQVNREECDCQEPGKLPHLPAVHTHKRDRAVTKGAAALDEWRGGHEAPATRLQRTRGTCCATAYGLSRDHVPGWPQTQTRRAPRQEDSITKPQLERCPDQARNSQSPAAQTAVRPSGEAAVRLSPRPPQQRIPPAAARKPVRRAAKIS
jgi:hypothetical protein